MKFIRIAFGLLLLTAIAATMTACGDDTSKAKIRAVHASADAPNVDIAFDGNVLISNLAFKASSGYLETDAGQRKIEVKAAGTSTVVISAQPTLEKDKDYTLLALGNVAAIEPLLLTDNNAAPAAGNVKVRLVHASPTAGPVDIYVTAPDADLASTDPTLSNVPFKAASDYLEVTAGSYRVRITPTGTKTVAIDATLTLQAGQIRTAVAVDNAGGGLPLGAIVLEDQN